MQRLAKIANQRTANTAGIHLRNVDTCILQEATVNTDLTKLIFDQNKLFALVGFRNHLFDQCCFASAKKSGKNINLHDFTFYRNFTQIL